jgi:hypothetical protein
VMACDSGVDAAADCTALAQPSSRTEVAFIK